MQVDMHMAPVSSSSEGSGPGGGPGMLLPSSSCHTPSFPCSNHALWRRREAWGVSIQVEL